MSKKYYMSASDFIEVTCELADKLLQERLGDKYAQIKTEHSYTEEGQEHFNQLLDEVEVIFANVGLLHQDIKDPINEENKSISIEDRLDFIKDDIWDLHDKLTSICIKLNIEEDENA